MSERDYTRASDGVILELSKTISEMNIKINEIHQRQEEKTLPAIEKMEKTLYGNGKKGLCEEMNEIKTAVSMVKWLSGIAISLLGLFFVVLNFIMKH